MEGFLKFIRGAFSALFAFILTLVLGLLPAILPLSLLLSDRETPKSWFVQSGIYDNAPELINTVMIPEGVDPAVATDNPLDLDMQDLIEDIATPELAQQIVESAIDGGYDFLEGKTEDLQVKLDIDLLGDSYDKLFSKMASNQFGEEIESLSALRACTTEEDSLIEAGSFDQLSEPCLPSSLNLDTSFNETLDSFGSSDDGILPGESDGENFVLSPLLNGVDNATERIQYWFSIFTKLPLILLGSAGVLILLILVVTPWPKGNTVVGSTGLAMGIMSLGLYLLYTFTADSLMTFIQTQIQSMGDIPIPIEYITNLTDVISEDLMRVALYTILGILGGSALFLLIGYLLRKNEDVDSMNKELVKEKVVKEEEKVSTVTKATTKKVEVKRS